MKETYDNVDLNVADAKGVLKAAMTSGQLRFGTAWYGRVVELHHDGKWRRLARADYQDDVRTGQAVKDDETCESVLQFYLGKVRFGARITDTSFYVVDAFSDG